MQVEEWVGNEHVLLIIEFVQFDMYPQSNLVGNPGKWLGNFTTVVAGSHVRFFSPEGIPVIQGLTSTLSDSLGLVDFPVGQADFICHLPGGLLWLKIFLALLMID